jgi:ubiquinone/menaquinone biosynthesis C-methylase UbiE
MMLKYYEKKAVEYDNIYEEGQWRLYDDLTWHFVEPYLPSSLNANILDIGGGTGKWSIKLAQLGYLVTCADISNAMLDIAKKKVEKLNLAQKIQFKESDIRDMKEFEDNQFDFIPRIIIPKKKWKLTQF